MKIDNRTHLREILQRMPTEQLDELLNEQIRAKEGDGEIVRQILRILREREKGCPVPMTRETEEAWEEYRQNVAQLDEKSSRSGSLRSWTLRAASTAAVLLLLFTVLPQQAQAESLWEKLVRWTSGIVEFFGPGDNEDRILEYEFKTDNPGLQQVYDAVVELGVAESVVPMWLPEGSELLECKIVETSRKHGLIATFMSDSSEIIYTMDIYDEEYSHKYHKNEAPAEEYERAGVIHTVIRNNNRWIVFWYRDNSEFSIAVDCQENILYKILESIYSTEAE